MEENVMLVILLSTITALVVNDLLGTTRTKIVKATKNKHYPGAAQWGTPFLHFLLDSPSDLDLYSVDHTLFNSQRQSLIGFRL